MKRRRRSRENVVWVLVFVLCTVSVSHAVIDMYPADFRTTLEGQDGTTFQSWDFSVSEDLAADTGDTYNSYGIAEATVNLNDDHHYNTHNFFQGVWELNGAMQVLVPNNPSPDFKKDVWFQITYLGLAPDVSVRPYLLGAAPVDLEMVGNSIPLFGGWHQATYKGEILPNPDSEIFHITPSNPTGGPVSAPLYIDGMIIETQCIPEPASLLVMSLGVLIARGKLRRK